MGHDAVNVDDIVVVDSQQHWKHSGGADWGWSATPHAVLLSRNILQMPATVVNEKRPDGTYPRSPYWTKRVLVTNVQPEVHQAHPVDYWTSGYWGPYVIGATLSTTMPVEFHLGFDSIAGHVLPSSLVRLNVEALARTRFLNKLADASGKDQVQLGVAAGEMRETIGMASDLAVGLVKGIRATARAVNQAPATVAKALDSIRRYGVPEAARRVMHGDVALLERTVQSWLVYQFGLKPLVYDLYDASVWAQAQLVAGCPLLIDIKGGAAADEQATVRHTRPWVDGAVWSLWGVYQQHCGVHFSCSYEIPTNPSISQQLGIYNPAAVAWELLRFSWMVDYALDMGNWLRSTMAADGTTFLEGTKSTILRASLLRVVDETTAELGDALAITSVKTPLVQVEHFDRSMLSHGVMPSLLPGVKNKMGLTQLANSLAALTTLVGARQSGGPWHLRQ